MGMDLQYRDHLYWCEQCSHAGSSALEGLATVVTGVASLWIVQDFPDTARFHTDAEEQLSSGDCKDDEFSAAGDSRTIKCEAKPASALITTFN